MERCVIVDNRIKTTPDVAHTGRKDVGEIQRAIAVFKHPQAVSEKDDVGWAKGEGEYKKYNGGQVDGSGFPMCTVNVGQTEAADDSDVTPRYNEQR